MGEVRKQRWSTRSCPERRRLPEGKSSCAPLPGEEGTPRLPAAVRGCGQALLALLPPLACGKAEPDAELAGEPGAGTKLSPDSPGLAVREVTWELRAVEADAG